MEDTVQKFKKNMSTIDAIFVLTLTPSIQRICDFNDVILKYDFIVLNLGGITL